MCACRNIGFACSKPLLCYYPVFTAQRKQMRSENKDKSKMKITRVEPNADCTDYMMIWQFVEVQLFSNFWRLLN